MTASLNPQYAVEFEGKLYGPFTSADASVVQANTDAQYWATHNCPGAAILTLFTPASFMPPFPPSEATG
jgi:hypothetical protein